MEENTVDHDSTTYMKVHVPDLNHKGDHASSQCMDPTRVMLASQLFMEHEGLMCRTKDAVVHVVKTSSIRSFTIFCVQIYQKSAKVEVEISTRMLWSFLEQGEDEF